MDAAVGGDKIKVAAAKVVRLKNGILVYTELGGFFEKGMVVMDALFDRINGRKGIGRKAKGLAGLKDMLRQTSWIPP